MPPTTVVRVKGLPYIATKSGDGWNVIHKDTLALVAWVKGRRKDAQDEIKRASVQGSCNRG